MKCDSLFLKTTTRTTKKNQRNNNNNASGLNEKVDWDHR